jgi:two-component system sensor histidine kinase RegB
MSRRAALSYLRLSCNLRWLAMLGEAVTLLVVMGPLHVPLSPLPLWSGVVALGFFNLYATWRIRPGAPAASDVEVFLHTLADIALLTWLIAWSGGIENPFASLFLLPIALSILALPTRWITATAIASAAGYAASTLFGNDLPPVPSMMGGTFGLHKAGMLVNFAVSAAVVLLFFSRVATAWRRSEQEVARLREQFVRNEGIVALATHAAAVAHELNTPLGTMTLLVDDLQRDAANADLREQFTTLRLLLDICRDRVRELAAPAVTGASDGISRHVDVDKVIEQWQLIRPTVQLHRSGSTTQCNEVDPAVGHLLLALLNNAADASEQTGVPRVDLYLQSDAQGLHGEIRDYGVGFEQARAPLPAELFRTSKPAGLGIGLALSHATVERLGGSLSMQATEGRGVRVAFNLPAVSS